MITTLKDKIEEVINKKYNEKVQIPVSIKFRLERDLMAIACFNGSDQAGSVRFILNFNSYDAVYGSSMEEILWAGSSHDRKKNALINYLTGEGINTCDTDNEVWTLTTNIKLRN